MTGVATASEAAYRATLHSGGRYGELGLTGLEIAAGQTYGDEPAEPLPPPAGPARDALADVLEEALRRPPCLVAFSGGRDSSTLLAVAADTARRRGLEPPIPATHRFPDVSSSDERDWQELVVRHLGLDDWLVLQPGDTLDVVGPVATATIARHGPMPHPNAHFLVPLAERARGGTLISGLDGDGVLGGYRWSRLGALARGARPRPRDLVKAAHFAAPGAVQRAVAPRLEPVRLPWLAAGAERELARRRAREVIVCPRRFDDFVDWVRRRRHLVLAARQHSLIAADAGTRIVRPFLDPRFLSAYASEGGARGFGDRTATVGALAGDLLPERLVARPTKASFGGVFMGERARALAAAWDGDGIDPALVDADVLRAEWRRPEIPFRSAGLIQWLWLRERSA